MGFRSGAYAKIWELEQTENAVNARISISRKDKNSGQYTQAWGGYARFYGDAAQAVQNAGKGGRIKLGEVDVTNRYDAEKKITSTYYSVYTAEVAQAGREAGNKAAAQLADDFISVPDDLAEDGLPFR